ncbi:AAA domain-containing protein [Streptomyces zhaozhouensis]|uniref:AAA domain-containing protein n=1 Tax=Streptomyces zhaozhouensis TaxID=1300267 RepID=A0A286DHS8_9ACTN|nr:AAA family ATPase [Streptomyces zhaozhouensis]SOD58295.1 AAA domain-containing protein [Streptomyces zhaozhouensis]
MRVILVSGPSGSGKTTVARLLAESRLSPSVHLHTDDFYAAIRQGALAPYLPEAHEQNRIVTGVIARAAAGYAAGGYHTVVDGVVGPWFLGAYEEAAEAARVGLLYVVLRPDRETALARGTSRSRHPLTDRKVLDRIYDGFADLGPHERNVLDSTGLTPEETADAVLARR